MPRIEEEKPKVTEEKPAVQVVEQEINLSYLNGKLNYIIQLLEKKD